MAVVTPVCHVMNTATENIIPLGEAMASAGVIVSTTADRGVSRDAYLCSRYALL